MYLRMLFCLTVYAEQVFHFACVHASMCYIILQLVVFTKNASKCVVFMFRDCVCVCPEHVVFELCLFLWIEINAD